MHINYMNVPVKNAILLRVAINSRLLKTTFLK